MEVYVDDETKLTLHGLQQYYVKLKDNEKNRKLFDLLDLLEFNQVRRNLAWWKKAFNWFSIVPRSPCEVCSCCKSQAHACVHFERSPVIWYRVSFESIVLNSKRFGEQRIAILDWMISLGNVFVLHRLHSCIVWIWARQSNKHDYCHTFDKS